MKNLKQHNLAIAAVGARWLSKVVGLKLVQYGRAAHRDERNGFPYSAAMQWRKAAELFTPGSQGADYCWREWERIMHLPRRLAEPIPVAPVASVPANPVSMAPLAVKDMEQKVLFLRSQREERATYTAQTPTLEANPRTFL